MQKSLINWLVKLMKLRYREEWARLCQYAHAYMNAIEPSGSPQGAAYWLLSRHRRGLQDPMLPSEPSWACEECIQLFADAFPNQMVGRKKGTLETIRLDPALISVETLRFAPDELVLDNGELIIVDVRVESAPAPPPNPSGTPIDKLIGKEWVAVAFARRRKELRRLHITQAGGALAEESKTAPDCRKPLSKGYCTNELRKLGIWKPQPRHSPKQRPSR
jgi:hypothetical protein